MPAEILSAADAIDVARILARKFASTAAQRDRVPCFPVAELTEIQNSGLLAVAVAREYGGIGGSFADAARVVSAISEADPNIGQILVPHYWGTGLLAADVWDCDLQRDLNQKVARQGLRWTNGYAELSTNKHVQEYTVS